MQTRSFQLTISLVTIFFHTVCAEENKQIGRISGYLFGDYYYMLNADTAASRGIRQYSSTPKDFQAFQFRRLYVNYDQPLTEQFAFQVIIESNDRSIDPAGRFGFYVKTAFLEWKNIFGSSALRVGLVPTLICTLTEKIWNYRSLERTLLDYRNLGQPSDMGISLRGTIDHSGILSYGAMISNGTGAFVENNKYKKYAGELLVKPFGGLSIETVADYEPASQEKNKLTLKGQLAYQSEFFTVGAELSQQVQSNAGGVDTAIIPRGLSLFAWAPIPGLENITGVVRYDIFDPNTQSLSGGYRENFLELAVDYMPIPNVHFMPNLWMNSYIGKAMVPRSSDVVARLTFFYIYK